MEAGIGVDKRSRLREELSSSGEQEKKWGCG